MKQDKLLVIIGRHIRKIRIDVGYSQSRFAKLIHMQPSYFKSLENGDVNINLKTLIRICDALNKDVAEFIKDTGL